MSSRARPHQAPMTNPRPTIARAIPKYCPGATWTSVMLPTIARTPMATSAPARTYQPSDDGSRGRASTRRASGDVSLHAIGWRGSEPGAETGSEPRQPIAWSDTSPEARRVEARPREPSSLGWYVLAGALVAIGVLAMVGNITEVHVAPGQYFGIALAIVGLGLVIGAWWGRARLLILLGLAVSYT